MEQANRKVIKLNISLITLSWTGLFEMWHVTHHHQSIIMADGLPKWFPLSKFHFVLTSLTSYVNRPNTYVICYCKYTCAPGDSDRDQHIDERNCLKHVLKKTKQDSKNLAVGRAQNKSWAESTGNRLGKSKLYLDLRQTSNKSLSWMERTTVESRRGSSMNPP